MLKDNAIGSGCKIPLQIQDRPGFAWFLEPLSIFGGDFVFRIDFAEVLFGLTFRFSTGDCSSFFGILPKSKLSFLFDSSIVHSLLCSDVSGVIENVDEFDTLDDMDEVDAYFWSPG